MEMTMETTLLFAASMLVAGVIAGIIAGLLGVGAALFWFLPCFIFLHSWM
nr:hypothetical protein [Paenalcaligenes hominis]